MELSNNRMRIVANLGQHLQLVSDSQDVQAIREHLGEIYSREKQADWEARLLAMDATGQYTFTPEQDAEISELAAALRENRTRKTFGGEVSIRESSVREHQKDAHLIKSWEYWDRGAGTNPITAELRLRQFGRVEAFKRAGLASLLQN